MYKTLRVSVLKRILEGNSTLKLSKTSGIETLRTYSGAVDGNCVEKEFDFVPFKRVLEQREDEAKRSVLFESDNREFLDVVISMCLKYGEIENVFEWNFRQKKNLALIEMKGGKGCADFFRNISFTKEHFRPKTCSPFVSVNIKKSEMRTNEKISDNIKLNSYMDCIPIELCGKSEKSLKLLYEREKMNDFSIRLRFLVVLQLKNIFSGIVKNATVLPFGGSINNFGSTSSDLDLTLVLMDTKETGSFVYKTKENFYQDNFSDKYFNLSLMLLKNFIPGCQDVMPIPMAKVPIVKFHHHYSNLDCDLSVSHSDSGLAMTEMFYIVSFLHPLVKPMVFIIKKWARSVKITTHHAPGHRITNFGLLSMVVFFLQQKRVHAPPLPPLNSIKKYMTFGLNQEEFSTKSVRGLRRMISNETAQSLDMLDEAVYSFFDFYSKFNFRLFGLSTGTGKLCENNGNYPLLIENPLDQCLNVTKQVNEKELQRIKKYMQIAKELYELNSSYDNGLFNEFIYNSMETQNSGGTQLEMKKKAM